MSTSEKGTARATLAEPLLKYNLPEDSVSPYQMGRLWNYIPANGLREYVLFCNLQTIGAEHLADILAGYSEAKISDEGNKSFHTILDASTKHVKMVLLPMQKLGFVSSCQVPLSELHTEVYYRIHPLLTLLSRNSVIYQESLNDLAKGIVKYQAYRLKDWPWKYEYGNPIWQPYLKLVGVEFTNNLCAAVLMLPIGYQTFWTHVAFKRIILSIQKSLVNSLENQSVVVFTWTSILNAMMAFPDEYCFHDDLEYQFGEISNTMHNKTYSPEEIDDFEVFQKQMLYFERKYLLAQVGMNLTAWQRYGNTDGLETNHRRLLQVLNEAPDPEIAVKDPDLARSLQASSRRANGQIKILERLADDSMPMADFLDWWRKEGNELLKAELEIFGVDEFPHERYNVAEGESLWAKIPIHMNPTSTIVMSFVLIKEAVDDLLEAKNYAKAREVICNALHSEINFRGDHAITKVKLMELLTRVDETDQKWSDAFQHRQDAEELEDSLLVRPSNMKKLNRSLRLTKAAERLGNTDHVKIYIKKVLDLANRVGQSEPQIEAEAMKGLYKLDLANTIDGPISTIFLLIHGAKSRYRLAGSRFFTGEWIAFITETHAQHHNLWLLGPPDDRAQSVLISNALRIFGSFILSFGLPDVPNLIFGLYSWFVSNNEMEKVDLLFHDLEERLFVGPGVEPGCRLTTLNLRFPEQNALFEFMYTQGMAYLERNNTDDSLADIAFQEAPYAATGPNGQTLPPDYIFPTELVLRLAGYIVDL